MDYLARAGDFENEARKKLYCWSIFGIQVISPDYVAAAELYRKAATAFKLAESWDRAGAAYVKRASCHFELNRKHLVTIDFKDAAHCYKKSNILKSIFWLERCVELLLEIGMPAIYYEEIAELYEQQENFEMAILYYEKAADLFHAEDVRSFADRCVRKIAELYEQQENLEKAVVYSKIAVDLLQGEDLSSKLKMAQFASQLEQYPKAIEIYEDLAQQSQEDNSFTYGYLLNAGICKLCKGDVVAVQDALEQYVKLYPNFSKTPAYVFLANLAVAFDEEDVTKFTDHVKKYGLLTHLDSWKITLLSRVTEALEAKTLMKKMI